MDDPNHDSANQAFSRVRLSVIERDHFTCRYCGLISQPVRQKNTSILSLKASGYLEVHHVDDDHGNNHPDNLVTICPFCHCVFHVGFAGHSMRAKVIYCPWISQENLSLLFATLGVAKMRGGKIGEEAKRLLVSLGYLSRVVEDVYGDGMSDPANLATALGMILNRKPEVYQSRNEILQNIRMAPELEYFEKHLEHWAATGFLADEDWETAWKDVSVQCEGALDTLDGS